MSCERDGWRRVVRGGWWTEVSCVSGGWWIGLDSSLECPNNFMRRHNSNPDI